MDYEVKFDIDDIIKKLGLDERGRVQQFVTNEVLRRCEPYIPFDIANKYGNPGQLRDSGHIEGTEVVWQTPYARNLYYHPEYHFQGGELEGGLRGAYWAERMLQNGGTVEIEQGARRMVNQL